MTEKAKIDRVKQYLKGEIIFQEGQPSEHFYILQKGEVEVSIKRNEKRFIINTLGPGDFFGEMGLLSNEPRSASCRAMTFVEVVRVGNEDFKNLLKNSHPLNGKIINLLLSRLKRLTDISINNTASVNSFYAVATLLDLNFKATTNDYILEELFVKQIALMMGLLPHQAKSIIQQLVDFGLIRQERKLHPKKPGSSFQNEGESRLFITSNNLLETAKNIQIRSDLIASDLELMEIKEALDLYDIDQKKFYSKMSVADFPDHLFFINKPVLFDLIRDKGKQFFEKASVKNIDDITCLDDLIFVDKRSIQLALQEIEVYDAAKLVKSASVDIAEILMGCFSTRMKGIIENTIDKISIDDDLEIRELEKTFITIIKRIKKIPEKV
ncbi:MAG: cyclic nucleotide-binding domain-containing protein [Methylobacter sp.]|nr:MAG: cyclic nucleotide-binding domain-containing protein [Methylobacter sp.]